MPDLLLCLTGIILQTVFIVQEQRKHYVPAVILKGAASLMFILLGLHSLRYATLPQFGKMVVAGLVLGGIGDVLLNLRFVMEKNGTKVFLCGILAFFAGHVMYLIAMIPLSQNVLLCAAAGVAAAALLLWRILTTVTAKPAFKVFGIFYIGAVVLMAAFAIGNWLTLGTPGSAMCGIGAVLFLVSDVILIFNTFTGTTRASLRVANLSLYYAGQLLIALCMQLL